MLKKSCLLILIFALTACSGNKNLMKDDVAPELVIQADDKVINYSTGLNQWNGSVYDRIDNFHYIMSDGTELLEYVDLGSVISISFQNSDLPDTVQLYDYIIDDAGNQKYTDKEVIEIPISFEDGIGKFTLDTNYAAFFSSNSSDYEKAGIYRGFKLLCRWGENECEYGFILKTDAGN